MALAPGDRIDNWQIVSILGEGGMGAVYRAQSTLVDDVYAALKVTHPRDYAHARERFGREVKALLRLNHPGVVRVQGFGEDPVRGILWFAMDLVEGHPLDAWVEAGTAFPIGHALGLFAVLADGLAHAHERGVAHRDLKPANVIVRTDGSPVMVDFGISATEGESRLTRTGAVIGTPQYLPPEALDGRLDDPMKGDLYALGQMLVEVITGGPAFPVDLKLTSTQNALRVMHLKVQRETLDPGDPYPEPVRALIRDLTHEDPARRIPSARQLVDRLAEAHAALADPGAVYAPVGELGGGPRRPATSGERALSSSAERAAARPATPRAGVAATWQGTPEPTRSPRTAPGAPATDPSPEPVRGRRGLMVFGAGVAVTAFAGLGAGLIALVGVLVALLFVGRGDKAPERPERPETVVVAADGPVPPTEAVAGLQDPVLTPRTELDRDDPPPRAGDRAASVVPGPPPPPPLAPTIPPPQDEPEDPDEEPPAVAEVDEPPPTPRATNPTTIAVVSAVGRTDEPTTTAPPPTEATEPKGPVRPPPPPNWTMIAGVRKGASDSAISEVLGPGASMSAAMCRSGESATGYLDGGVIVCRNLIGGARRVVVLAQARDEARKRSGDPKLAALGQSPEGVVAVLGDPQARPSGSRFTYDFQKVVLEFTQGKLQTMAVNF